MIQISKDERGQAPGQVGRQEINTVSLEELDSIKTSSVYLNPHFYLGWPIVKYQDISVCAKSQSVRLCIVFKDKTTIYLDLLEKETETTKVLHSRVRGNIDVPSNTYNMSGRSVLHLILSNIVNVHQYFW